MTTLPSRSGVVASSPSAALADETDARIAKIASDALTESGGRDTFELTDERTEASGFGTGLVRRFTPLDSADPVFRARLNIAALLLGRDLRLIDRVLGRQCHAYPRHVLLDAHGRLSEMLEHQVMRPSSVGGLDLHLAASGEVSVVGWARSFLSGPNGARKVASRIGHNLTRQNFEYDGLIDVASTGMLATSTTVTSDSVLDVLAPGSASEARISANRRHLALASAHPEAKLRARAATLTDTFGLAPLNTVGITVFAAGVLSSWLVRNPSLALRSLNARATVSHSPVRRNAAFPNIPSALVNLWQDWSRDHVLIIRSLDEAERWADVLARAALSEVTNPAARSMR